MKDTKREADVFGEAIRCFYHTGDSEDIVVHSPDFDEDVIPVAYLFRSFQEMPPLEQKALRLCRGKVLDVGCGAGSHALFLQEQRGLQVTAVDISPGAVDIARKRGVEDVRNVAFEELSDMQFDTLLFLMNGIGIIGSMDRLDQFFSQAENLLAPGGQILLDSSDLIYLFEQEQDGGVWVNSSHYYGELSFRLSYKGLHSKEFPWLYLDFDRLKQAAEKHSFHCQIRGEGSHFDYLAQLIKKK